VIRSIKSIQFIVALSLLFTCVNTCFASETLFDFTQSSQLKRVEGNNSKFFLSEIEGKPALVTSSQGQGDWSQTAFKAAGNSWDLSKYNKIYCRIRNLGSQKLWVLVRADNPGANGPRSSIEDWLELAPNASGETCISFRRKLPKGISLSGMRGLPPGYGLVGYNEGSPKYLDPADINEVVVSTFMTSPKDMIAIEYIRAEEDFVPAPSADKFFPFIDQFGQYKFKKWDGKVTSVNDLKVQRQDEQKDLEGNPSPANWDKSGGWANGPQLKASGNFRTEKMNGKWWLVDPQGHLFFSMGVVAAMSAWKDPGPLFDGRNWQGPGTFMNGRENWFEKIEGAGPETYLSYKNNSGQTIRLVDHFASNLRKKYGKNWDSEYAGVIAKRFRSWGINTIGPWSGRGVYGYEQTPYTRATWVENCPALDENNDRILDYFDPKFEFEARNMISKAVSDGSKDDPLCIGYFVDNEIQWGDSDNLGRMTLLNPNKTLVAKGKFIEILMKKYTSIGNLNYAWNSQYGGWQDLFGLTTLPTGAKIEEDLILFSQKSAERYFSTIRKILKEEAPNKLYLGCRFSKGNEVVEDEAAKYCDVISYNNYANSVALLDISGKFDLPVLIGEFGFGADDRGPFHPGLVRVRNQNARSQAYKDFIGDCLRDKRIVGCHWFMYADEPTTGRRDGENFQYGFVDIADRPYQETVSASRALGKDLYSVRSK
jgi:hypothetical protein